MIVVVTLIGFYQDPMLLKYNKEPAYGRSMDDLIWPFVTGRTHSQMECELPALGMHVVRAAAL